ncbi:type III secretion system effector Cif [Escherichia coli]|nr:type III secretion system effector Cif [Escherichia coli]EIB9623555.1 type III secretion system effector Cif [Escherichia coli]
MTLPPPTSASCLTGAISVNTEAVLSPMQHTSALHVRDFASLCSQNLKANVLLNSDDHEVPIHQKNPAAIMQNIDSNIKQMATDWGMSIEEVEVIIGREKGIVEPSCGVTANAIMKLFLDKDGFSYCFENEQTLSLEQLQERLSCMPECKSFVLRVNDGALGHAYIVDIPKGENSCRPAFLYQSDLGEGVTRKLRFEDWMTHKALTPILLDDICNYFSCMSQNKTDLEQIATLFDIDGNVKMLRKENIQYQKHDNFSFQLFEYDTDNIEKNIEIIKSLCS